MVNDGQLHVDEHEISSVIFDRRIWLPDGVCIIS